MSEFFVLSSWFFVSRSSFFVLLVLACWSLAATPAFSQEPGTRNKEQETQPFRPEAGKFPPFEKSHAYRGELVFVDHANRRGSIRVEGTGKFYRNDPQPFAMLPYGVVSYQGAPADLRDIPLGTVMHVRAYGPSHIASNGKIVDVTQPSGEAPVGSSGIQIQFETELIIEGIRPGRVVRVRPERWPKRQVPREEYLFDGASIDERFPTPAIFPKY